MNAVKLQGTRYGYKAFVGGALWQLRQWDHDYYSVFTTDDIEAYDGVSFKGDYLKCLAFLRNIARDYADCMSS